MKQRMLALIVLVAVGALVFGIVWQRRESPQAKRERLVEQFIAALPDSLDNDHIWKSGSCSMSSTSAPTRARSSPRPRRR